MIKKIKLQQRRRNNPTTTLNEEDKARFETFWQNMYSNQRPPELRQSNLPSTAAPTEKEVRKAIISLANDKAPGPDNI